jgi:hypothetical protein
MSAYSLAFILLFNLMIMLVVKAEQFQMFFIFAMGQQQKKPCYLKLDDACQQLLKETKVLFFNLETRECKLFEHSSSQSIDCYLQKKSNHHLFLILEMAPLS